jgi:hypothetical protein
MSDLRSSAEIEIQPEDIPLPTPTNSMITVRLSDCQSYKERPASETPYDSRRDSGHSIPSRPRSISLASSRHSSPTSSPDSGSLSPVDWDVLEKTEEQEPKDEGTDEVC